MVVPPVLELLVMVLRQKVSWGRGSWHLISGESMASTCTVSEKGISSQCENRARNPAARSACRFSL